MKVGYPRVGCSPESASDYTSLTVRHDCYLDDSGFVDCPKYGGLDCTDDRFGGSERELWIEACMHIEAQ